MEGPGETGQETLGQAHETSLPPSRCGRTEEGASLGTGTFRGVVAGGQQTVDLR